LSQKRKKHHPENDTPAPVIPLQIRTQFCDSIKILSSLSIDYFSFPFELGFALTFHKVQGKTLKRVILSLNKSEIHKSYLTFNAFLVGFSRVQRSDHLRRLPSKSFDSISHVASLKLNPLLPQWFQSYENHIFSTKLIRESFPTLSRVFPILWDASSNLSNTLLHLKTLLDSHPAKHMCLIKYGHLPLDKAIQSLERDQLCKNPKIPSAPTANMFLRETKNLK
jgi:hypothetical protein